METMETMQTMQTMHRENMKDGNNANDGCKLLEYNSSKIFQNLYYLAAFCIIRIGLYILK